MEPERPEADETVITPEMIVGALKNAAQNGKGLKPYEIKEYIARTWWPSVRGSSIGPIAWRMYSRGELRKDGEVYSLPGTDWQKALKLVEAAE